jgi:hypothetical protein
VVLSQHGIFHNDTACNRAVFNGIAAVIRAINPAPTAICDNAFEKQHLLSKLQSRNSSWYNKERDTQTECNPIFKIIEGEIEQWEKLTL